MKRITFLLGSILMLSGSAFAEGKGPAKAHKMPEITAEQRNKMADIHEKMAACLRSDRALSDCHDEAMKSCQDSMGGNCPMMMGHMGHHGKGMQHAETN